MEDGPGTRGLHRRTAVALALVVLLVGGLGTAALVGVGDGDGPPSLERLWTSDTERPVGGNHHAAAVARVDGQSLVYAPVNGRRDTADCGLVALDGADGSTRWSHPVAPENCTIHAVADPAVADRDADGRPEVLVATTAERLLAFDALSSTVEADHPLSRYGYTSPVVADLLGDDRPETVVVDVSGRLVVLGPDGTVRWTRDQAGLTWSQPVVADADGDGAPEVAVADGGDGGLQLYEADGTPTFERVRGVAGSVTWMAAGEADGDAALEFALATSRTGRVVLLDGATGEAQWRRDLGTFAAVGPVVSTDAATGEGDAAVYATAADGVLRRLDAATGETVWRTRVADDTGPMMPPPARGDLDGDGDAELLVAANDGVLAAIDPVTGEIVAERRVSARVFAPPTLGRLDADGDLEGVVVLGDGRVLALDVPTDG